MKISELKPCWILCLLLVVVGCSTSSAEPSVAARVSVHLARTIEAHNAASDLWDRLLLGENVNCIETFDAPPPLALSQQDVSEHPQSIDIQDAVNRSIAYLHQLHTMWEAECQTDAPTISQARVRQAQEYLVQSATALQQASDAWDVWQP